MKKFLSAKMANCSITIVLIIILELQMMNVILLKKMMIARVKCGRFCFHGGIASSLDSGMSGPHLNGPLETFGVSGGCFR